MRTYIKRESELKMSRGMKIVVVVFVPVWLGMVGTMAYVAWHFISKFW